MDWIERAYRKHYGIEADVLLSRETNLFLASLRAAEPKGVRMWTAVEWRTCDAPVFHRIAHRVLIPVEVREVEVEAEEPEPKVEPEEQKKPEKFKIGPRTFEVCGPSTYDLREGHYYILHGGSFPFIAPFDRRATKPHLPLRLVRGDEEYDPNVLALARALHDLVEHAKGNRP